MGIIEDGNKWADNEVRAAVIAALKEVLESGHDIGGMGEYGRGWNDRGIQTKMIVKEIIKKWQGLNKQES